ncbi:Golgi-specific brefeldin A-resistance guanine nucleotide exchange factor 1 isoform X2 [Bacillus rossius redtenbacheri]|uniref:Golgi-specific brefeldin A-resistance guanine nucleotide exchange factor 1 isoform X2 n=1 Tax=Bacillus rossius redtenbacheri TaxID=93214 RepID=UPI002FDC93C7
MACPGSGIYVLQGEMNTLLTALRRVRWSSHSHQEEEQDALTRSFLDLKDVLNQIADLRELDSSHYLSPFLEVIRSEETTGPVTSLALAAVHKFLSYGLIAPTSKCVPTTVENIADAVTHARFVGTDQASDGVVLLKILQVLRLLVSSSEGAMLTNESVCEILLSCFRICFETRLSELLRRAAEQCLREMVQVLFSRLPQFQEDTRAVSSIKKLKMRPGGVDAGRSARKGRASLRRASRPAPESRERDEAAAPAPPAGSSGAEPPEDGDRPDVQTAPAATILDMQGSIHQPESPPPESTPTNEDPPGGGVSAALGAAVAAEADRSSEPTSRAGSVEDVHTAADESKEYVNPQGVRFVNQELPVLESGPQPLVPYGVLCVRELLRFLVSLCNPLDKQNTEAMLHMGLTLLTVALEVGADSIANYASLMALVTDSLCRNVISLLSSDRPAIFAADLQVSFLLFESLRTHLKFQLELFLTRLVDIVVSDSPRVGYEQREIALECVVQLWRIPGLVTELYLNYDCDLYCPNLFEDITKLLSKNAFPVAGLYSIHLLSLDALLTIIDAIEAHCHCRVLQQDSKPMGGVPPAESAGTRHAFRSDRQKVSQNIPSHEQLMAIKRKKKLLSTGTEHFNSKPKKGVQFLQEQGLLSEPLDPAEVAAFLRENPRLDKKMIGEYISNRANLHVLDCFVKSFDFTEMRIDEALRLYLETFRLPGESPLISQLMEHFAEHWHRCNGEPFANADAAFTLAYAIIMLNVDQHNHNVKRQNTPMTAEAFKRNLKKVNGGEDFDQEMLVEIYNAIKSEEIVMPAEQTGLVKENYLWKVLLRRGSGRSGVYIHAPNGLFDHDLFSLVWGPTVAALSFVFDKSNQVPVYQKAISGFRKCAMISGHYGMSSDLDNLVISLCKFTTLLSGAEGAEALTVSLGGNAKAQLAARTVFGLALRHGDILRDGWRNVLECVLVLYRCKLLPKALTEAEDFVDMSGKISLQREELPSRKAEPGLLSSLYSYIALGAAEPSAQKLVSPEDQERVQQARQCVRDCHLEHLVTESKFLRLDSLQELVKALMIASQGPDAHASSGLVYDEDAAIFFLELLLKVIIQNKDRAGPLWAGVHAHLYGLLLGAAPAEQHFLVERVVVGLLRLAVRLVRREDMSPVVLQSLRMLLLLRQGALARVSHQVAYGLYELLKTSAANIHSQEGWAVIFTLLECVGAGAPPPRLVSEAGCSQQHGAKSDGELQREYDSGLGNERGYTSDSELSKSGIRQQHADSSLSSSPEMSPPLAGCGWILVGREGDIAPLHPRARPLPQAPQELQPHSMAALVKCCESLAFLVRDVAHITPYNFDHCVHCIRTFVDATLVTGKPRDRRAKEAKMRRKGPARRRDEGDAARKKQLATNPYDADESDPEEVPSGYHQVFKLLLDLMHTLHTRTAHIFSWWQEEMAGTEPVSLWEHGWCPLLQGIARLCCDARNEVRVSALMYLQRALLVHDLQMLTADEWEACFSQVLFPLLSQLLEPACGQDPAGMEETRIRAATLLSKVFLHHLTPLLSLPTFTALWLTILDFMDKYMRVDNSDLLLEAIPESLKNIILVMDAAEVFSCGDGGQSQLWTITWDRIGSFLPDLRQELFKSRLSDAKKHEAAGKDGDGARVAAEARAEGLVSGEPSAPRAPAQQPVVYPHIAPQVTPLRCQLLPALVCSPCTCILSLGRRLRPPVW